MKKLYKKIISMILSLSILGMSFFITPQKTEAIDLGQVVKGVVTGYLICYAQGELVSWISAIKDIMSVPTGAGDNKSINASSAAKECGFDYAANQIKQELISGILRSTTEWVKGGYNGKPAFITNPDQFLEEATDQFVADIIEHGESTKFLCDSFRTPLKFAINLKFYSKGTRTGPDGKEYVNVPTCTMTDIERNVDNALGDLKNFYSNDGKLDVNSFWTSFMTTSTESGNNAYGAYIELSDDLERKISEKNKKRLDDVRMNGGYMSIERCDGENDGTYAGDASNRICGQKLTECINSGNDENLCNSKAEECIQNSIGKQNCEYVTPGKVISDEVTSVLGMERENLQMADEFDELIAVIITQMMSKVFDSNKGLSGINRGGDGADYESSTERDISVEKASMLKQYSPRAYDIQLKIYQSLLDAIEPAENNFNPLDAVKIEEEFWSEKNDSMLETEKRLVKYWDAAGFNSSVSSDWNGAFISYISGSAIKPVFDKKGVIKSINTDNKKYVKGEAQIFEGTVVCNFKDRNNVFCDMVTAVGSSTASALGTQIIDINGKKVRTLKRRDIILGSDRGLADKENMLVITKQEGAYESKYDSEYYKNLFGEDYKGPTGTGVDDYNKSFSVEEKLSEGLEKWNELKSEASNPDGRIFTVRSQVYVTKIPLSFINKAISAYEEAGIGSSSIKSKISTEQIEKVKSLRDQTLKDREEAYKVSEEIKKTTTIQELWEIGGNNTKADLSKAYKIYRQIAGNLKNTGELMGIEAQDPENGGPGHRAGVIPYTWIILNWMPGHLHSLLELEVKWGPSTEWPESNKLSKGERDLNQATNRAMWHPEFTIHDLENEFIAPDSEIESMGLTDSGIEIGYDPLDDIRNLDSGLYDEDNYDYSSI